jgi:hypothetical protein
MKRLPSAAVTLENGTPIAWVFLGMSVGSGFCMCVKPLTEERR